MVPNRDIQAVKDDPDDDKFLETTIAGDADDIVTGDSHLQDLGTFEGINIVNPHEFSEILESQ